MQTSCAPSWSASGPARWGCSAIWTAGSRWRSLSATRARPTRAGWARRACRRFCAPALHRRARSPPSCWPSCAARPRARRRGTSSAPAASSCWRWSRRSADRAQIKALDRRIATAMRAHPDGEIFRSLFRGARQRDRAATLLAEIGDCRARYPHPRRARRRRRPGRRGDRVRQAQGRVAFAGHATSGCAPRSARWLTAPATGTPGRKTATPAAIARGHDHRARCARSAVPGAGSCGAAGKTASRMTPPATAACNSTSPSRSPPRRGPSSTTPPPSAWPPALRSSPRTALDSNRGDCRAVASSTRRLWLARATAADHQPRPLHSSLPLTLTVSAARRRWGGRRVPFCAGRAAGRALTLPFAQRAICVRGSPGGPGDVPPVSVDPAPRQPILIHGVDTGRLLPKLGLTPTSTASGRPDWRLLARASGCGDAGCGRARLGRDRHVRARGPGALRAPRWAGQQPPR